jgi:hypothetical protein
MREHFSKFQHRDNSLSKMRAMPLTELTDARIRNIVELVEGMAKELGNLREEIDASNKRLSDQISRYNDAHPEVYP